VHGVVEPLVQELPMGFSAYFMTATDTMETVIVDPYILI